MNKRLLILGMTMLVLVFTNCSKSDDGDDNNCVPNNTGIPTAAEIASVQAYLSSHSITATQHPGGFFYIIVTAGSGPAANLSSTITVKYSGTLENGTEFDHNPNPAGNQLAMAQLIKGWQMGIPLIKKGGTIKLFLPPSLGYGCSRVGSIPPGSNLIFTIDLVDVQ